MLRPKDAFYRFVAGVEGGRTEWLIRSVDVQVVSGLGPGSLPAQGRWIGTGCRRSCSRRGDVVDFREEFKGKADCEGADAPGRLPGRVSLRPDRAVHAVVDSALVDDAAGIRCVDAKRHLAPPPPPRQHGQCRLPARYRRTSRVNAASTISVLAFSINRWPRCPGRKSGAVAVSDRCAPRPIGRAGRPYLVSRNKSEVLCAKVP